jgi:hypothetical protein
MSNHTAPLPIVGWACFEYVGYELAAWDDLTMRAKRYPVVVARYVIACGRGPKWAEIVARSRREVSDALMD